MVRLTDMNSVVRQLVESMLTRGKVYTAACCGRVFYGLTVPARCGTCGVTDLNIKEVDLREKP